MPVSKSIKVWGRRNSINVQKVLWTLAELDIEHERIDAGLAFGVVDEDWFAELNPNRTVPVLQDGETVIWESNAIVRYLATKFGLGRLMPDDPEMRARADMWMDWQQTTIMPWLGPVFLGLVRTPENERDSEAIRVAADHVRQRLSILDAHLRGSSYLTGNQLCAADIPLGCVAYRWFALPVEHGALPNVRAWYARLTERPHYGEHVMLALT